GRRHGRLVFVDTHPGPPLRSERYRLVGRPDELRQLPDGRPVPVEIKSRRAPSWGPARSHVVQVLAYCLILEDVTGISPPYGLLRYSDGSEFTVRWDSAARREILALRRQIDLPYDGRATPSPSRCRRCAWVESCDARSI
ncbi:MAG: Dna2/Cas4 domain-containing protein, partial [Thermoplasmata archaeon]|nr:Dna2/Cas4 domain-containing protein [Thermoplasmata archaeon]